MKRTYIQPNMIAVKLQNQSHLMEGTTLSNIDTNLNEGDEQAEHIRYNPNGITGDARVKGYNVWDDEW